MKSLATKLVKSSGGSPQLKKLEMILFLSLVDWAVAPGMGPKHAIKSGQVTSLSDRLLRLFTETRTLAPMALFVLSVPVAELMSCYLCVLQGDACARGGGGAQLGELPLAAVREQMLAACP